MRKSNKSSNNSKLINEEGLSIINYNEAHNKEFPDIIDQKKDRNINTALSCKSDIINYINSKAKIKNKILEESNERFYNIEKNHLKQLIPITKDKSKVKNYDNYIFPKTNRGFPLINNGIQSSFLN